MALKNNLHIKSNRVFTYYFLCARGVGILSSFFSVNNLNEIQWCISYSISSNGEVFIEKNTDNGNSLFQLDKEKSSILHKDGYSYYRPVATEDFLVFFSEKENNLSLLTMNLKNNKIHVIIENFKGNILSIVPYDKKHFLFTRTDAAGENELIMIPYESSSCVNKMFVIPKGNSLVSMKLDVSIKKDTLFILKKNESTSFALCVSFSKQYRYKEIFKPTGSMFLISAKWSPNGKYICCMYREQGKHKVVIINIENNENTHLDLPSVTEQPIWYDDNETLLLPIDDWPYTSLYKYNFKKRQYTKLEVNFKGVISQIKFYGNKIYFLGTTPNIPSSLFSYDNTTGRFEHLTKNSISSINLKEMVVKIPSGENFEIPCILYESKKKIKASIVMLHGGPSGSWTINWSPVVQAFVANGFNVLLVNPRGSTIRTTPLPLMKKGDFGVKDCEDVITCINWLIEEGYGQKGNVHIYGHSYGGFLAYQTGKKSTDLSSVIITSSYLENHALLKSNNLLVRSFATNVFLDEQLKDKAERINSPILQINGAKDSQIPINVVKEMFDKIKGEKDKFIELTNEGHAFKRKENMVKWIEAAVEFLLNNNKAK